MSFCKAESNFADDTFSAIVGDVDAVGAEVGEATSLPAGTAEEEAVEGVAPVPNCPDRKTWAALASFDLTSCTGAAFCASVDEAADGAVEGEVAEGELAVNEFPVTLAVGVVAAAM